MIILGYVFDAIYETLWAIPLIVILWFLWPVIWRRSGRPRSLKRQVVLSLFLFYLAMIVTMTIPFFSFYESIKYGHLFVRGTANLVPFLEIRHFLELWSEGGSGAAISNIFGNILMFLPLGFFLPYLWPKFRHWLPTAAAALFFSAFIEIVQSFSFRGADIDDVILNTVGAILGYGLYRLLSRLI